MEDGESFPFFMDWIIGSLSIYPVKKSKGIYREFIYLPNRDEEKRTGKFSARDRRWLGRVLSVIAGGNSVELKGCERDALLQAWLLHILPTAKSFFKLPAAAPVLPKIDFFS